MSRPDILNVFDVDASEGGMFGGARLLRFSEK